MGKGETAHFEQFHLFPQCFPKGFSRIWRKGFKNFCRSVKSRAVATQYLLRTALGKKSVENRRNTCNQLYPLYYLSFKNIF